MVRQSVLLKASSLHSLIVFPLHRLMSSFHSLLGRPLPLLPSTPPSIMSLHRVLCLLICPKYFSFLVFISFSKVGAISNIVHTSSFVFFSNYVILLSNTGQKCLEMVCKQNLLTVLLTGQ